MKRSLIGNVVLASTLLLLIACGDSESTSTELASSTESAGSGKASATLDGVREELETWPTMCGLTRSESSFVMRAGPNNGDNDPRNNALNLSIGGESKPRALTSIRYQPPTDSAATEYVTLTGDEAVWIQDNRFVWSGETQSGKRLEVDVECP